MRGGNKILKRVFYQSAFASLRSAPESRAFYERKRAEGKRHTQALIALARRRVNVVWAMLREGTTFVAPSGACDFHRDSSRQYSEEAPSPNAPGLLGGHHRGEVLKEG